ncbi:aminopeptidase [Rheinheimera sp. SA_1]|uniref:M1 family metallopeptidase n=1 Tax=Rheinheimera sp. SA_1 TaxID=1827365 RepID=UPI0007FFDFC9|nr:M1 family metallopeptidase [Rheinheimera sp. SA_1]OBP15032.1 aminopeptidase [Rheinheimera sp. SA_1]
MLKLWILTTLLLSSCLSVFVVKAAPVDHHSFANIAEVYTNKLSLDLTVDFEQQQLHGFAEHTLTRKDPKSNQLILDSRALVIEKVLQADDQGAWRTAAFKLGAVDAIKGQPLTIQLTPTSTKVRVYYRTTAESSGLQWLNAAQTSEKQQPFLFSQSQAIHARSWIPLQDTPALRVSYQARIRTPKQLMAVMSADNSKNTERDGDYQFVMPQPIPAYLIAIAVGDLHFQPMSDQTGIYAEKTWLAKAAAEFSDTQKMMDVASKLYGEYPWGRYDLLILPASFPFGGMENPRLSFITPTVITGDKSLVSLIAHELAHSWSGNLVTNSNWNDLWLNEGFTNFFENRLMAEVYGPARAAMEYSLSVKDLQRDIAELEPADTALQLQLTGRDPDDAFSQVAYVKGQLLLQLLENKFGREKFDAFISAYFKKFAFQSMDTQTFLQFLQQQLLDKYPGVVSKTEVEQWVFGAGLPAGFPMQHSDAFALVSKQLQAWLQQDITLSALPTKTWTVHEWLHFINQLPRDLAPAKLAELDAAFALSQSSNAEIFVAWSRLTIPLNYLPVMPQVQQFLLNVGRTKFVVPLYRLLLENPAQQGFAKEIYQQAKPGYHPLTQAQIDKAFAG